MPDVRCAAGATDFVAVFFRGDRFLGGASVALALRSARAARPAFSSPATSDLSARLDRPSARLPAVLPRLPRAGASPVSSVGFLRSAMAISFPDLLVARIDSVRSLQDVRHPAVLAVPQQNQ